jgi:cobalt/nickel transport system permease protein
MSCHAAQQLDLLGYGSTCIHRLDSRVKLIATLIFILCVASFSKYTVAGLIPFFAFPLALGILGRVPARLVLRILAATCPLAVMVGIFNPLLDRAPAFQLGSMVVGAGWLSFVSILLRFALSLGMALVLISTTSMPGLLHGMAQLRVPRPFVTQIQFLYRYLFLLVGEGQQMSRARALRNPARRHAGISTAKKILASLLWRTWERAERVYLCMKTRGFRGDVPTLRRDHYHASDFVFLAGCAAACLLMRFLPVTTWTGDLFLKVIS